MKTEYNKTKSLQARCADKMQKKYLAFQSIKWWGGNTEMEIWTWHSQRSAIRIHTHANMITTYKASRSTVTIGRQQTVETIMEKWNIIREVLTHQCDTACSGNHYTAVIIEDKHDRPMRRLRTTEPQ